jgi:hypothetical protein
MAFSSPSSLVNRSRLRGSQNSPSSLSPTQKTEPLGLARERHHAQVAARKIELAAATVRALASA